MANSTNNTAWQQIQNGVYDTQKLLAAQEYNLSMIKAKQTLLVNNVVLSRFLGLCPFLGVSKKTETSVGMGAAVIFVITLSSMAASLIYTHILIPLKLEYLQTIVFILVIAALVQFVEMVLKKNMPSLYEALGVYLPLITTNCAVLGSIDSYNEGLLLIRETGSVLLCKLAFALNHRTTMIQIHNGLLFVHVQ